MCEDGIEKYVPHDHRLSSLGQPPDTKWRSSRPIFLTHPHTRDRFLYYFLVCLCFFLLELIYFHEKLYNDHIWHNKCKNTVNSEILTRILFLLFTNSVKSICYITRQNGIVIMRMFYFHDKNKTLKKSSEFTVLTYESMVDKSTCSVYFINIRIVYARHNKHAKTYFKQQL